MIYNMRGDEYHVGPVMLSDIYSSSVGAAKDGVAASQKAIYDVYNLLNNNKADVSTVVSEITRDGNTFTAKNNSGTQLFTFTQKDDNTTYSAGTGLSLSNNQFSLANTTVTSGTYGPSGDVNGANGNQILVPQITVDAQGRITSVTNRKYTSVDTNTVYTHPTTAGNKHIPAGGSAGQILRWSAAGTATWGADNNTTYGAATTSAAGLMSAADKSKLNGLKYVVYQKTTQSLTLTANQYRWITPTQPSDKSYAWYLFTAASDNSFDICHLSVTGVYWHNRASKSITYADTGYYWIGMKT